MKITAYEGSWGNLHRHEHDALAEIICESRGTLAALLGTSDHKYQERLQDAIIRAAEIITKLRKRAAVTRTQQAFRNRLDGKATRQRRPLTAAKG